MSDWDIVANGLGQDHGDTGITRYFQNFKKKISEVPLDTSHLDFAWIKGLFELEGEIRVEVEAPSSGYLLSNFLKTYTSPLSSEYERQIQLAAKPIINGEVAEVIHYRPVTVIVCGDDLEPS